MLCGEQGTLRGALPTPACLGAPLGLARAPPASEEAGKGRLEGGADRPLGLCSLPDLRWQANQGHPRGGQGEVAQLALQEATGQTVPGLVGALLSSPAGAAEVSVPALRSEARRPWPLSGRRWRPRGSPPGLAEQHSSPHFNALFYVGEKDKLSFLFSKHWSLEPVSLTSVRELSVPLCPVRQASAEGLAAWLTRKEAMRCIMPRFPLSYHIFTHLVLPPILEEKETPFLKPVFFHLCQRPFSFSLLWGFTPFPTVFLVSLLLSPCPRTCPGMAWTPPALLSPLRRPSRPPARCRLTVWDAAVEGALTVSPLVTQWCSHPLPSVLSPSCGHRGVEGSGRWPRSSPSRLTLMREGGCSADGRPGPSLRRALAVELGQNKTGFL